MAEYHIFDLIVNGVVFNSEQKLNLEEAVKLAKEFTDRGYVFHVVEKLSENRHKYRTLNALEKALEK